MVAPAPPTAAGVAQGSAGLRMAHIAKAYGGVIALSDGNLECFAGEVHGLVGENGAGKSTLVKILNGVVQCDSGEIMLNDEALNFRSPGDAVATGISMVYQELSLIPDLTVAQNIFLEQRERDFLGGTSRRALRSRCERLFAELGLEPIDPDRLVNSLRLSQRQIVEIAKVIARDPKVVVFDEATSALGHAQSEWLLGFVRQWAAAGKIVIYISHKLSEVRAVSDRITVFRNGVDVGTRSGSEASTDDLVGLILGRRIERLYPERQSEIQPNTVLEVRNLQVGSRLKDVSLSLRGGEILGVAGLEGQGQNELFRGLFGVQRTRGEIILNGKPITLRSARDALRHEIGLALVPEDRATQGLLLPKSVANNAVLAVLPTISRFGFLNREKERAVVNDAIQRFSIKVSDPSNPVNQLSGGNQQKVLLAKLLATRPKVLMLYDCTRGVDVGTKAEIFALLRELSANGTSILLYSTEIEEILNMCDRVIVIRRGRIEVELPPALMSEPNIVRTSMGEPLAADDDAAVPREQRAS